MALQQRTKERLLTGGLMSLVLAGMGGLWYWETIKSADVVALGMTKAIHADLLRYHHTYGKYPGGEGLSKVGQFGAAVSYEAVDDGMDFAIPLTLSTRIGALLPGSYVMSADGLRSSAASVQ